MTIVQENLIRVIDEKGLKKNGVAKRAGFTAQALSDMLAGRKTIRADMVPALAAAVGEPISELFRATEKGA